MQKLGAGPGIGAVAVETLCVDLADELVVTTRQVIVVSVIVLDLDDAAVAVVVLGRAVAVVVLGRAVAVVALGGAVAVVVLGRAVAVVVLGRAVAVVGL